VRFQDILSLRKVTALVLGEEHIGNTLSERAKDEIVSRMRPLVALAEEEGMVLFVGSLGCVDKTFWRPKCRAQESTYKKRPISRSLAS
jgi:hypothetical protein